MDLNIIKLEQQLICIKQNLLRCFLINNIWISRSLCVGSNMNGLSLCSVCCCVLTAALI
jgi:hypothetical protein